MTATLFALALAALVGAVLARRHQWVEAAALAIAFLAFLAALPATMPAWTVGVALWPVVVWTYLAMTWVERHERDSLDG